MSERYLEIEKYIEEIEDPRSRVSPHVFRDILIIALMTILSGQSEYWEMEVYAEVHMDWLKEKFKLAYKSGIPSEQTFKRVLESINPKTIENCLFNLADSLREVRDRDVIAFDGKSSRGSKSSGGMLHCLNAWSTANGICIGQSAVDKKTNEITAIPEMMDLLNLKNSIITIDAMGCQKKITHKIIHDAKADYVIAFKKNHKNLYKEITEILNKALDKIGNFEFSDYHEEEITLSHGRIEHKRCLSLSLKSSNLNLEHIQGWSNLESVSVIESKITSKKDGKTTTERRYYISSLNLDSKLILKSVNLHWEVENKLHWVLDVNFSEDASKIRTKNGPRVFSAIRKIALNFIRKYQQKLQTKKKLSIKRIQKMTLLKPSTVLEILNFAFS